MVATRRPARVPRGPRVVDARPYDAARAQLAAMREKYDELLGKYRQLVRRARVAAEERTSVWTLALFALEACDGAVAIADGDHVLLRNHRWNALERDRTAWRATARDPSAPAAAPTLLHLATGAARALLARSGPTAAAGRYERPDRGDVFDVRFERVPERAVVGVWIRDVTRLVAAERKGRAGAGRTWRPPRRRIG